MHLYFSPAFIRSILGYYWQVSRLVSVVTAFPFVLKQWLIQYDVHTVTTVVKLTVAVTALDLNQIPY